MNAVGRNSRVRSTALALAVVVCLSAPAVFAQSCPLEGSGAHNDPKQNVLKNRPTAPSSYDEMTVAQFKKQFKVNLNTPRRRASFSQTQLDAVAQSAYSTECDR